MQPKKEAAKPVSPASRVGRMRSARFASPLARHSSVRIGADRRELYSKSSHDDRPAFARPTARRYAVCSAHDAQPYAYARRSKARSPAPARTQPASVTTTEAMTLRLGSFPFSACAASTNAGVRRLSTVYLPMDAPHQCERVKKRKVHTHRNRHALKRRKRERRV